MTSGPIRRHRAEATAAALVFIAGLLGGACSWAQEPAAGWSLEKLMRDLGQVQSAKARFVERKYLKVLNAPLELRGTLTYNAPGWLEKRTHSPRPETLTLDGDRLTIENQARRESRSLRLQDYPVLRAFVESMRSTLSGDIRALERFYRVELEGGPAQWRLYLVPRDQEMRTVISLIRIGGSRDRVDLIEVNETSGDRSVMKVYEEHR
ncbi:MAG: LolA-related protein [Burkholderiales bacterium]